MKKFWANKSSKATKIVIASVAVFALVLTAVLSNAFMAGGVSVIQQLMNQIQAALEQVYAGLLGIVTVLAVVIIAWCFVVKMFSKNPRSIDEATQWMKRVAISWLCFMLISLAVKFGLDIVATTSANTSTPWS